MIIRNPWTVRKEINQEKETEKLGYENRKETGFKMKELLFWNRYSREQHQQNKCVKLEGSHKERKYIIKTWTIRIA